MKYYESSLNLPNLVFSITSLRMNLESRERETEKGGERERLI